MSSFSFNLSDFVMVWWGLLYEALPFVVLGTLVSGAVERCVSRETVVRFFPRSRILGIGASACMGLIFPMCECGVVPVVRRLMRKGVPASCGVTYLLAAPIINPLVILSTMVAFREKDSWTMSWVVTGLRVGMGLTVAVLVGIAVWKLFGEEGQKSVLLRRHQAGEEDARDEMVRKGSIVGDTLVLAAGDFMEIGAILVLGTAVAALLNSGFSHAAMSESDDNIQPTCHCHPAAASRGAGAWMEIVTLLLLATFLAFSYAADRLGAFLAPAYLWLTPAAAVALYAMGLARLIGCFRRRTPERSGAHHQPGHHEEHHGWQVPLWGCVVVLLTPVVMALWINPQQLSAEGARKRRLPTPPRAVLTKRLERAFAWVRGQAAPAAPASGYPDGVQKAPLPKDPTVLDLLGAVDEGWAQEIEGQFVTMLGQCDLRDGRASTGGGSGQRFDLYRMVVTCCIADATSVSVEVAPAADVKLEAGGWVRVGGIIKFDSPNDPAFPVVHAATVTKIAEPSKPYL